MLKISLITLAVLAVVVGVGAAWAKHRGYCAEGGHLSYMSDRLSRRLDLDEVQRTELQRFADTLRGLRGDWREGRGAMREEVQALLAAPTLDRDRAMDLLAEWRARADERKRLVVDGFADFSDSLTPDQRERLAGIIGERMDRRFGRAGWGH
jgi:Spy/CpxP family protein refolding chaperone